MSDTEKTMILLQQAYPDLVNEIKETYGAGIGGLIFKNSRRTDDPLPELFRALVGVGYVMGLRHAKEGKDVLALKYGPGAETDLSVKEGREPE